MRKILLLSSACLVGLASTMAVSQEKARGPIQTANIADPGEGTVRAMGRDDALRIDAQALADAQQIPFGQALKIVRLNEERGDLIDQLRNEFKGRVAGISVQQDPEYSITVRLKGAAIPERRIAKFAAGDIPITFETGASATVDELVSAYANRIDEIRQIVPEVQDVGVDERTGQIAISVYATGPAAQVVAGKRDELAKLLGHPVRVDAVAAPSSDMDVRGGSEINGSQGGCTSGFTVKNSAGTTAMSTAGHCEGINIYYNPNRTSIALTHTGIEHRDADQDVELHTSGYAERAEFYADSATTPRTLTGRRLRTSTAIGDTVCHRGKSTGYSCGKVSKTNTILTYTNACNGQTCSAVWVTVDGDAGTACYGGDSGGPVFISQTAVGLMKGGPNVGTAKGQCSHFYYMSTDYLPSGWSLLYG